MATKELRAIYGGDSRQAMARAIRAEIEDGEAIMAAEAQEHRRCTALARSGVNPIAKDKASRAWQAAHARRVEAENAIRARYGMPLRNDAVALPPVM